MTSRRALLLGGSLWLLPVCLLLTAVVGGAIHHGPGAPSGGSGSIYPGIAVLLFIASFATAGALLVWQRTSSPIGWLLSAAGLSYALAVFGLFLQGFSGSPRVWGTWLQNWLWGLGFGLAGTLVLLLFPTGALPSPRWRPALWLAGIGLGGFVVGHAFVPGVMAGSHLVNPIGIGGPAGSIFKMAQGTIGLVLVAAVLSIVSVGVRFRRSRDLERQQMKWLLYAAALILLAILVMAPISAVVKPVDLATNIQNAVTSTALAFVPVAIGIAVLRYRLYDIDIVVNKTVVYGSLAAFITAVYVAIVVGIGAALGLGSSPADLPLSILATAVVSVAFQPVRNRVQRLANRLVYGVRATPYEVLAGFVQQVGGTYAAEDVLPRMARALADGTGAASATVWLEVGSQLRPEAAWPAERLRDFKPLPMPDGHLPDVPGVSLVLPIVHRGETLGALTLTKPRGEPLSSIERKLAEHLAGQAGLVVRNVALTEDLLARLRDLESSRARIVTAEDEEQARIERRIREGARRELETVAAALDAAVVSLRSDRDRAFRELAVVGERATLALESLREVARGIYPPLLADKGLVAALEAQARRVDIPVTIETDGIGRRAQDVESAVYFCCVEALQNAAAHGRPSKVTMRVGEEDGELAFEIADDGCGFDVHAVPAGFGLTCIRDRIAALDGEMRVESAPGRGTIVSGSLPLGSVNGDVATAPSLARPAT